MSSKRKHQHQPAVVAPLSGSARIWAMILPAILFFLLVCLSSQSTAKPVTMGLVAAALALGAFRFDRLRRRLSPALLALIVVVALGGISTFYAVSGKFALYEFLKMLSAFCMAIILLVLAPEQEEGGRWMAAVLEGSAALAALVSIDLLSTRLISGAILGFFSLFTPDFTNLGGVEEGIRMTSLYANPNIFAGCIGIGVLLSLGLVQSSAEKKERTGHLCCLYINALAFVLAFSMGASAAIAVAFLVFLLLEHRERLAGMFLLMVETLVLTVVAAGLISATSFHIWDGLQPIPLLCTILGAAGLCLADRFVGQPLSEKLAARGKLLFALISALLAVLVLFVVLALSMTGSATVAQGDTLRRAAYPEPGSYTLSVLSDGAVSVTVRTQNRQDTMMHTDTVLYSGQSEGVSFTVPEDSLVVWFEFSASDAPVTLDRAVYTGNGQESSIPLDYKLLPGFIANRLQGLKANQNAIQRLVFFEDGMKLFRRSPVIGLGLGSFETSILGVQSFFYETKYVHNHYIQALVDNGVLGLIAFAATLFLAAAAVLLARRKEASHPLLPALGAGLVFMAIHAATEVVFSSNFYLPMAYGLLAIVSLCCLPATPMVKISSKIRSGILMVTAALILLFAVLLGCNMVARSNVTRQPSFHNLEEAAALDKFEWADYMLSYVNGAASMEVDAQTMAKADAFATILAEVDSNTIPIYLAEFYFTTDRPEQAFAMVKKYLNYVASDSAAWNRAISLLLFYESNEPVYLQGVTEIRAMLKEYNAQSMGQIVLDASLQAFLDQIGG